MSRHQQQKEDGLVRMLRYVLGINPAEFGLVPNDQGWVALKDLLQALHDQEGWRGVRQTMIADAATRLSPDDFELTEKEIRAARREWAPPQFGAETPPHLYLGVRRKAWPHQSTKGLEAGPGGGPIVLARQSETALTLGRRRDQEPILVTVQAHQAADQGVVFAAWGPELFLCEWLPAKCLMGPPVDEHTLPRKAPQKKAPGAQPEATPPAPHEMPGSFMVLPEHVDKPYKRKGIKKDISWKKDRREKKRQDM